MLRKATFFRVRLCWSLRKRLTVVGGIPTGLLAGVLVIVVIVPMKAQN